MSMLQLAIIPRDVLFCRDARPMLGSTVGEGGTWPLPGKFHSALLACLYHKLGIIPVKGKPVRRLQSLRTAGPFPTYRGEICFPVPGDLVPGGKLYPAENRGSNNLPKPLCKVLNSTAAPSKEKLGEWITAAELERYAREGADNVQTIPSSELFSRELRPGIGIDPQTRSTNSGQFYLAEYLRLREDNQVGMAAFAELNDDLLEQFFSQKSTIDFCFGGQRCIASMKAIRDHRRSPWPPINPASGAETTMVKWVLLSPALFNNGFLPDWVDRQDGRVKLRNGDIPRRTGESRDEWRERLQALPPIKARLVAAKVDKPLVMSGWKLTGGTEVSAGIPRATRLLVPAGSVYYFDCEDCAAAAALHKALHGRSMSGQRGEQGFGIGITVNV